MEKKPLKKRLSSIFRWVGWVLLVQLLLINISAALYAYKLTHFFENAPQSTLSDNDNIFTKSWKLFRGPRYPRPVINTVPVFPYDTISLSTSKGLPIDAWYGTRDSARGVVILFHGISGTKASLMDEANEFRYWGYNVMMVDFRGHGNSGSNTTTIGRKEAEEVKLAYDYIAAKGEKNIFIYGSSMGAVAVSKAVSTYELKPAGVILETPFLSLQSYLKAKARILGFPKQPFAFFTTFWIGAERGFNGFRHKTTRYVKNISCPVLIQCGTLDNYVMQPEIQKIYDATASSRKKLVMYEGGQHESLLRKDPLKWRRETEFFLSANRN